MNGIPEFAHIDLTREKDGCNERIIATLMPGGMNEPHYWRVRIMGPKSNVLAPHITDDELARLLFELFPKPLTRWLTAMPLASCPTQ